MSEDRRKRFFQVQHDGQFVVEPAIAAPVSLHHHNLVQRPLRPASAPYRWDVILCRNVLIYLTDEARHSAISSFVEALGPQGYLFLGSSEHVIDARYNLQVVQLGHGGYAWQHRPGTPARPGSPPPVVRVLPDVLASLQAPVPHDSYDDIAIPPPIPGEDEGLEQLDASTTITAVISESSVVGDMLRRGAQALRASQHDDALAMLEAAACYDPFIPETYCLIGLLLREMEANLDALEAFRKALFLAPQHWFAAFEAALIYEHTDDLVRARRHYGLALDAIEAGEDVVDMDLLPRSKRSTDATKAWIAKACRHGLRRLDS